MRRGGLSVWVRLYICVCVCVCRQKTRLFGNCRIYRRAENRIDDSFYRRLTRIYISDDIASASTISGVRRDAWWLNETQFN